MENNWLKKGCIFKADGSFDWNKSHSQVPVAHPIEGDRFRIYYASRDSLGKSRTSYIETDRTDPTNVLYVHDSPILELGEPGTFDDSGIMPTCIIERGAEIYLYYIGWTTRSTVPYSNAIGVAVSLDGGKTFQKKFNGPVIGQGPKEPFFAGTCEVIDLDGRYVAYYLSCNGWQELGGKMEPFYDIKIAVSHDGFQWAITGKAAVALELNEGGIASASVIKEGEKYYMWFSVRGAENYRVNSKNSYRIGFAESADGLNWVRKHSNVLPTSEHGWDSEMIAYPNVIRYNKVTYLFYNGNGFGETGFGYAKLEG